MTNRDLNLTVGVGLHLEKNSNGARYLVELLGYRVAEGLIISAPLEQNERIPLTAGEEVTIRYMGGVSQYAFRSRVTHIAAKPYLHIHLEYPLGIEATMTRRAVRMPVRESVIHLAMHDGGKKLAVDMKDISFGGASLVAPAQLGCKGERFNIDMPTLSPTQGKALTLSCVVRHVTAQQRGEQMVYHHGVEFIDVDSLAHDFISRFIEYRPSDNRPRLN